MSKSKSKQAPSKVYEGQVPALDKLYSMAGEIMDASTPLTETQEMANQMKLDYARSQQPFAEKVQDAFMGAINPMNRMNPLLGGAIDTAIRPIKQFFNENTMSGITDEANMAGQYGGSRQGIAEGIAQRGLQDNIADISHRMAYDDYNRAMASQMQAFGMAPAMMNLGMMPLNMMSDVGTLQQNAPWADIMRYSQVIGAPTVLGGGGSSRGGTTSAIGNLFG